MQRDNGAVPENMKSRVRSVAQKLMSKVDGALGEWEMAIDRWARVADSHSWLKAEFLSWEAGEMLAAINAGASARQAEMKVRGTEEWNKRYLALQKASIVLEETNEHGGLAMARWERARSSLTELTD